MGYDLSFAVPFSAQESLFCGLKIHIHRNLSGFLFPSKMSKQDNLQASAHILSQLTTHLPKALIITAPLESRIKDIFGSTNGDPQSYIIDPIQHITYAIINQNHLSVTLHRHKLDFQTLYHELQSVQSTLSTLFNFSHSSQHGYLTSHPESSGLGLDLEAYIFCPLLHKKPILDERFSFEPCFNSKSLYCLKTVSTHNLDLSTLLQTLLNTLSTLITAEISATQEHLKVNKDQLLDRVSKSLALLKGAYQLNFTDTLDHLLNLKLGFHLGFLEGMDEDISLKLLSEASKSCLADHFHQKESPDDWLHERAVWMQDKLAKINLKT